MATNISGDLGREKYWAKRSVLKSQTMYAMRMVLILVNYCLVKKKPWPHCLPWTYQLLIWSPGEVEGKAGNNKSHHENYGRSKKRSLYWTLSSHMHVCTHRALSSPHVWCVRVSYLYIHVRFLETRPKVKWK